MAGKAEAMPGNDGPCHQLPDEQSGCEKAAETAMELINEAVLNERQKKEPELTAEAMREGGAAWKMGDDDQWYRPDLLTAAEVRKYAARYSRADAEEAGVGSLQHQLANSNPLLVHAGVSPPAYRAMLAETGVPAAAAIALWVKLARLFLQT